jgi:hypothetical protein
MVIAGNKAAYMQLPPALFAFFHFSTGPTPEPLAKMMGMTSWCSQQDLLVSTVAEMSIALAGSEEVHEMLLPTNLWYLVVTLLLQWAPTEAWEDPAATPGALQMAISCVLNSLLKKYHRLAYQVAQLFLQAMWLEHEDKLALQAQLHYMRTSQTALKAKVTKLEEQVYESLASSLGGSPSPTLVMLRARPIDKCQLEHDQQLDQHGQ